MRIFYTTAKSYPATTADHIYIRELSKGFITTGSDFQLIVNRRGADLLGIPTIELLAKGSTTLSFLFWLIRFRFSGNQKDCVFIANDFNLITVLVWVKRILRFKYKICSDWHMMTDSWKDSLVAKGSDILVTTSDRLRNIITSKFPMVAKKIFTVRGGVDPNLFKAIESRAQADLRRELHLPVDGFLVGYVGLFKTIGMEKGIGTMIESIRFAKMPITYVFVGGTGEEIKEYLEYAESQGVQDRCLFVSRQEYEKVALYEKALDVLVIPYPDTPHFADYGFPMKVYEYMASGTPIVYSDLEIIGEVLKNFGTPFVPGDPESLTRALETALRSRKKNVFDIGNFTWEAKARAVASLVKGQSFPNQTL
ncbi:MAG: glycosyltransferase family 4 protein [Candidatus Taylorbacteria bacterium]